jgi:hypothetical protein
MRRISSFAAVRTAARSLADVEECLYYGQPALKVHGKMFVCMASHSTADPDSLVVRMDLETRDACIAEQPDVYYVTDHYRGFACVLVRLPRVRADALRDLVQSAYRFIGLDAAVGRLERSRRRPQVIPQTSRYRGRERRTRGLSTSL